MTTILLVDDSQNMLQNMANIAQGPGRQIITAMSAEEAINLILKQEFDVIVTDYNFGGYHKSGLDIIKVAKEKYPLTQVIMVTSYGTPDLSAAVMDLGSFDYLERGSPGTNHYGMLQSKIALALKFRKAVMSTKPSEEL